MKCIAVLIVLSALCCCALSAAVPAAGGHSRSKTIVRPRAVAAKFAQRRSSEAENADLAAEDPANNEIIPPTEQPTEVTTTAPAPVPSPPQPQEKDIESADEDDDEDGEEEPSYVPAFAAKQPHTFFPMQFGNMRGGAVAVANAFSTGKGTAASHAVAYGSSRRH